MAAPTYRSSITIASGTTSAAFGLPSGTLEGDLELIFAESSDSTTAAGTPTTPNGWTKIFERTEGGGALNVTTLTIFARVAPASPGSVTVSGVGNHIAGFRASVVVGTHDVTDPATDIAVGAGNGHGTG